MKLGVSSFGVVFGKLEAFSGEATYLVASFYLGTSTVFDVMDLNILLVSEVLAKRGDPPNLKSFNFYTRPYLCCSFESAGY